MLSDEEIHQVLIANGFTRRDSIEDIEVSRAIARAAEAKAFEQAAKICDYISESGMAFEDIEKEPGENASKCADEIRAFPMDI